MSDAPIDDESIEEFEERLQEETRDAYEQHEAEQSDALDAIASGSDLEEYQTVALGELELEVKAWLPGSVEDTVLKAQDAAESDDPKEVKESLETMISALAEMSTSDVYNSHFWRKYYDEYGAVGLILAVETLLEPASDKLEERQDAVDGFRPER
jgi:hypothetical protein